MSEFYSSGWTWLLNRIWQRQRKPRREQVMPAVTLRISSQIPAGTEGLCLAPNPHGYADSITYCTLGKAFCNVSALGFVSLPCQTAQESKPVQMVDNPPEAQPTPLKSLLPLPKL